MNEMSNKMKKIILIILIIINILTLSSCSIDQDDYLVRWWNGNIPTKLSDKKEKIWDICREKTKYLPKNTEEEREKADLESNNCLHENGFWD